MKKRLVKHGNSLAIVIDKAVLDLLRIDSETDLNITTDGIGLNIRPMGASDDFQVSKNEKVQQAADEIIEKYAQAFKKLA